MILMYDRRDALDMKLSRELVAVRAFVNCRGDCRKVACRDCWGRILVTGLWAMQERVPTVTTGGSEIDLVEEDQPLWIGLFSMMKRIIKE